jgi:carbon storage regulator
MLVLTRKANQSITLGDNIKLTVLSIENDRVSIGIDAPREIRVFRSELLEGTRSSNVESFTSQYIPTKNILEKKPAKD